MKIISEPYDEQGGFFGLLCEGCGKTGWVDTRHGLDRLLRRHDRCERADRPIAVGD